MKRFLLSLTLLLAGTFSYGETKFVEPPLDSSCASVEKMLETVFLKTGTKYSIEIPNIYIYGNVTVTITEKQELDKVLVSILEPKGLTFSVDEKGVYHIKPKEKVSKSPVFVEPPIDINNPSVKLWLETVFFKTGKPYSIEVDNLIEYGNLTLTLTERMELSKILTLILEPKGLTYYVDFAGVYRIKKKDVVSHPHAIIFVEPPIEFPKTPIKVALETLFLKTGVQYSIDISDLSGYGNVTLTINERQELDTVLALILEPKNLTFIVDAAGIYHIIVKESVKLPDNRITKQYPLTYITAGEIVNDENIKKLLTKNGFLTQGDGNEIMITNEPSVLASFEKIIKIIDVPDHANKLVTVKELLKVFYKLYFPNDTENEGEKQPVKYVEPPIDFPNTPLSVALEAMFLGGANCISIDVPDISSYGNVSYTFNKKQDFNTSLSAILELKGLTFRVDEKGICHIIKKPDSPEKK